jgi:hypothetical protein
MAVLSDLPRDVMIYTNEPAAVYLYTGRGNYVLPDRFDSATAQPRPGFEDGVARMQEEINEGRAVLALFDGGENISVDMDVLTKDLYLAYKTQGDLIYTAKP